MKKPLQILLFSLIIHSSLFIANCYSQWSQLPNLPVTGTVWDMYFANANTGWVTLVSPTAIIKTQTAGKTG